jgi:pimeloyl-ACP methyl ester carboxylesterase
MGIGAQMILWPEGFCDMLAARGFRVIRFDNRDVGRSTQLDHLGVPSLWPTLGSMLTGRSVRAPYSLEDMAADVTGLLDVLGIESAHIVGASMGGMIAQTMAITHPHRMRSLVSMMSMTGKPGYTSTPRALKALFGPPPRTREQAIERHLELFRVVRSTSYPFDEAALIDRAGLSWDRGSHPRGVLRQLAAIAATGDRTARLRFVRVPTLVVHGTIDPLIRPIGGKLTAACRREMLPSLIGRSAVFVPRPMMNSSLATGNFCPLKITKSGAICPGAMAIPPMPPPGRGGGAPGPPKPLGGGGA